MRPIKGPSNISQTQKVNKTAQRKSGFSPKKQFDLKKKKETPRKIKSDAREVKGVKTGNLIPPPLKMAAGSLERIIVAGGPSSTSPGREAKATAGSEEFVRLLREEERAKGGGFFL